MNHKELVEKLKEVAYKDVEISGRIEERLDKIASYIEKNYKEISTGYHDVTEFYKEEEPEEKVFTKKEAYEKAIGVKPFVEQSGVCVLDSFFKGTFGIKEDK